MMSKRKRATEPIFILKDEDDIILIDDPEMCGRLDDKVAEMEAEGFDEMAISNVLLQMIKAEGYE